MLEPRHFQSNKDYAIPKWDKLVKAGEVVQCETCGKWISPKWHTDCYVKGHQSKPKFESMTQCAVCFFKKGGD